MLGLRYDTPREWTTIALGDLPALLRDHAANERKVSQSALTLATQNPNNPELVRELIEVAKEELEHFQQVHELLVARGLTLGFEQPDLYIKKLRHAIKGRDVDRYLLDRLLLFGIVEARGCERFSLLADAFAESSDPDHGELADFYQELVRSEARHHALYLSLAKRLFPAPAVEERHHELLALEAEVIADLPLRPALH